MAKRRSHSIEFKRQVAQELIAGETLHALAKRYDISRTLIRIWVGRFAAGAFDEDALAADLLEKYEAKIAALERIVGRQALEVEFLKGCHPQIIDHAAAAPVFSPAVWWYSFWHHRQGSAMGQVLHGSARTTEAIRRAIQHSQASVRALAGRYGINPKTVAKWKRRHHAALLHKFGYTADI